MRVTCRWDRSAVCPSTQRGTGKGLLLLGAATFAGYCALLALFRARSFGLIPTHVLDRAPALGRVADFITPDSLLTAPGRSELGTVNAALYALLVVGLVAAWLACLWLVRRARGPSLGWIVVGAACFCLPLLWLPGVFSTDLGLYMFYGRMIAVYGENPILAAPIEIVGDPAVGWANWKHLPSAYGPVWLLFSGALSTVAGGDLVTNILVYKTAAVVLHCLTTVVVWAVLRQTRPQIAVWGAVFYGWNPLVLFETVGHGHNDVMVAFFLVLALLAAARRTWLLAVVCLIAGAMVKVYVLVLLPLLVLAWLRTAPDARSRGKAVLSAAAVAVASVLLLYAPLGGGVALLRNVRDNPAATEYQNSLWQLLIDRLARTSVGASPGVLTGRFDIIRNLLFLLAFSLVARWLWKRGRVAAAWGLVWAAYCVCAAWIWPWYLVPLLALAAVAGAGIMPALGAALTLGGLLYWLAGPTRGDGAAVWIYEYRAVLLFGPAAMTVLGILLRDRAGRLLRHGGSAVRVRRPVEGPI
ncbi:MAG: glycosyltransferase 87 family protein, partial [Chloroflexota bacterium]|nr:glycosyltransferase 87 family protein [Chloroflexota bacterium]